MLLSLDPAQGAGAPNAPGHTNIQDPLDAPVAGDSGKLPNVGITEINNKSANTSGMFTYHGIQKQLTDSFLVQAP